MTLKERFEAAKAALTEVKSAVEAGEKSAEDLQGAITELETVQAQIKAADEAEALMKGLETPKAEKADKEVEEKAMPRTLGENFVEAIKAQTIGKKFDLNIPAFKAATDTQTSPAGAVDFATTFDKTVVEAARVPLGAYSPILRRPCAPVLPLPRLRFPCRLSFWLSSASRKIPTFLRPAGFLLSRFPIRPRSRPFPFSS